MERHLPSKAGCFNFEDGDIRVVVEPIRTFSSCYFKTVPNRFKRFSGTLNRIFETCRCSLRNSFYGQIYTQ